jgi:DNA-binding transcriptional ArsR family regulator
MAKAKAAGPKPADDQEPPRQGDEEQPRLINDAALMRALSHPARISIISHLGEGGAATATECAELVGLSPSATSYHLRALAKAGLVEEAPGRGDGRERVWRTTLGGHGYTVRSEMDADDDTKQAERALIDTFLTWEDTRVRQAVARAYQEPPEWFEASFFSEARLAMTAAELKQLGDDLQALLRPYRRRNRPDPPPGARAVALQIRAFPTGEAL